MENDGRKEFIRNVFNTVCEQYGTGSLRFFENAASHLPDMVSLRGDEHVLDIATGTGLAPFYAMYRSGMSENKTLIHGVRHLNQFYFEDELEWSLGKNYVRCCSQEQSCDVFPGRVTNYLDGLQEFPDVKYYLCGKALMVVEVRDMLIEKGVDYGNIIAEIYF